MMRPRTSVALAAGDAGAPAAEPAAWAGATDLSTLSTTPKILGLGRAMLDHGRLLFAVVMLLNLVAFAGVHSLTPRYTAAADLIVGPREEQVVDLKAVMSGLSGTSDVIESEIQVLRSRQIARSVVQALNLDQMVEFNPALQRPGLRQQATAALRATAGWSLAQIARLGLPAMLGPASAPREGAETPLDPLSAPVDRFLSQLDVVSKGRSRVITVSFTSTDPALAATVPNAVADAYIANQLSAKTNATAQATRWLDERVAEMREQLIGADEAVEAYRRRAGIVPIRDSTLLNQQISEAGQELMHAHAQVAAVQGRVAAMAAISPNAVGLQRELAAAKAREQALEISLLALRGQIDVGSQSEIGLRALQREADADRNLYDKLLARARETKVQSGLQQADATVISRAERQEEPSFPKPALILPLFFVASCLVGLLLVLWLESLDRGFSTLAQLEAALGVPALAAIPLVRRSLLRRTGVDAHLAAQPHSSFAESIREMHTSLLLSGQDTTPRTILVTSALPGEGKSLVVQSIAAMMAACRKRVVVVECDLRKPAGSRRSGLPPPPGLMECLTGQATLDEALVQEATSAIHVLPAGDVSRVAPDLFASPAMRTMMQALSARFDLVLLDGGPALGLSETRHLCRLAERTVFVVRWQDTRCAAAAIGLKILRQAGAQVAGVVLTMVDPAQHRKHSPAGIYHKRLQAYRQAR